uniref:Chemokine interleukin-8-like domain-containing protein n=1 Tax=Fundulus heteroclitus TaxID=8078 RepID=A0A3Q2Q078_FUNHE
MSALLMALQQSLILSMHQLFIVVYFESFIPAHGPNDLRPGRCCFKFFPGRIPEAHILSIAKTHQSCTKRGFGDYCVNLKQQWAIRAFLKTPKNQVAPSTLSPA